MSLNFAWDNHNRLTQHDQVVGYGDGETGAEEGQKTVFDFRFRESTSEPWSVPVTLFTTGRTLSYDPPGNGYLLVTVYTTRDGAVSWQAHQGIIRVVGGIPATPGTRITTTGRRVTSSGAVRITTG